MFARPAFAGDAHAGLNFVKDQQNVILVRDLAQQPQKLRAEMIVTALTLDRLDDDRGDIYRLGSKHLADFVLGTLFLRDDIGEAFLLRQREVQHRRADARPREFGVVQNLAWVGIRQAHCVARATVERMIEMDDFGAAFTMTGGDVLPPLSIHGGLESVLERERAAINEKVVRQFRQRNDARERFEERSKLRRVVIGFGSLEL